MFGAFALAGTSVISARLVADSLGTFTISGVSLFLAVIGLLPFCWQNLVKTVQMMVARDWVQLLYQAAFGIFFFRMFLLFGLRYTSAGEAGILTGATPAVTALLAWLIVKEAVNKKAALGICCTVTGILILQGALTTGNSFRMEHFLGNILVLCAAICESVFNVLSRINSVDKTSQSEQAIDPVVQTTLVAGIACLLCLLPACFEKPLSALVSLGIEGWLALFWYGLVVTALAFVFWYAGIKRCSASTAAAFSGLMPFTALVLSGIILGESPGWEQWVAGGLVILGICLTGRCSIDQEMEGSGSKVIGA